MTDKTTPATDETRVVGIIRHKGKLSVLTTSPHGDAVLTVDDKPPPDAWYLQCSCGAKAQAPGTPWEGLCAHMLAFARLKGADVPQRDEDEARS